MKHSIIAASALSAVLILNGCATTEEGKAAQKGAASGAVGGAMIGLFLGALTGDSDIAARAAVRGAAYGATAGAHYGYTESRADQRNREILEAIEGADPGETADQAGVRHLQDFVGDWQAAIWVLDTDGSRINATGRATGAMRGSSSLNLDYSNVGTGDGNYISAIGIINYSSSRGFELSSEVEGLGTAIFVGEYVPAENKFNFYFVEDDTNLDDGISSSMRIEVRPASTGLIVIGTYIYVEGAEKQIESIRLTRA